MRQSPVAVQQLLARQAAAHKEDLESRLKLMAEIADQAVEQLRSEISGLTLVNLILTRRLGGNVTIAGTEFTTAGGRLQMMRDAEKDEWTLIALEPEPVEEDPAPDAENARVEGE